MLNIKVIEDWILVKPILEEEAKTPGGIIIAPTIKKNETVKRAKVVQISDNIPKEVKDPETGELKTNYFYSVGDVIIYHSKTGISIMDGVEEYQFLKYDGMMAIENSR